MSRKRCAKCKEIKSVDDFSWTSTKGRRYRRSYCRPCDRKRGVERRKRSFARRFGKSYNPAHLKRRLKRDKRSRRDGINVERWIWEDSRRSDRKKGLRNDLTKEFIAKLIAQGCVYCGETSLRMTVDRIDNDCGHTRDNVVAACIRCNYVRRDMPYEAWFAMASAMAYARERGLFGGWVGSARKVRNSVG